MRVSPRFSVSDATRRRMHGLTPAPIEETLPRMSVGGVAFLMGLASAVVLTPSLAQAQIQAIKIASAARPTTLVSPPGDPRLFVVEQLTGEVKIIENGNVLSTPFLTIPPASMRLEINRGFLGMAFDPNYALNGRFYTLSIQDEPVAEQACPSQDPGRVVVRRYRVSVADPNLADPLSAKDILSFDNWDSGHNAGWIGFNPFGPQYLYIATGDGGNFNDGCYDPCGDHCPMLDPDPALIGWAQDLTDNLHGKILRIDPDVPDSDTYAIPANNPFVGVAGEDEIWAYGLRNPWRNAFDRLTGDLYIADVGQGAWEELDFQPRSSPGGENWGWRCREGAHDFDTSGNCASATLLDPIQEYSHGGTPFRCSITGGEIYRGCAVPDLVGTYFYADFCSEQIWSLRVQGGVAANIMERTAELDPPDALSIDSITSFGLDAEGEIYIVDRGGEVFKIVPDGPAASCPTPTPVPSTSPRGLAALILALLAAAGLTLRRSLAR